MFEELNVGRKKIKEWSKLGTDGTAKCGMVRSNSKHDQSNQWIPSPNHTAHLMFPRPMSIGSQVQIPAACDSARHSPPPLGLSVQRAAPPKNVKKVDSVKFSKLIS